MSAALCPMVGAVISRCEQYRYFLWRYWNHEHLPLLCFIMLNPSKADAVADDPTVRKCVGFARRHNFGGVDIINLFAYRATAPADMLRAHDAIGPMNDEYLIAVTDRVVDNGGTVVCAWGNHGAGTERERHVIDMLAGIGIKLHTLRLNDDGTPAHPLMLPYTCALREWRP